MTNRTMCAKMYLNYTNSLYKRCQIHNDDDDVASGINVVRALRTGSETRGQGAGSRSPLTAQ